MQSGERTAGVLFHAFVERTSVGSGGRRYLWTDAFAVQTMLALRERTGDAHWAKLAGLLVDDVHTVLGRAPGSRPAEPLWLAGDAEAARAHPTRGGLRIGKPLRERAPDEQYDPNREWDRDGQYFHYLVPWMRALDAAAWRLGRPEMHRWARELAVTAHHAFAHGSVADGDRGLYWKMSVDLSRPLVPSVGQHDALDAVVIYAELDRSAAALGVEAAPPLRDELADACTMLRPRDWRSVDPLGIGALLVDAQHAIELGAQRGFPRSDLVPDMLATALHGLRVLRAHGGLNGSAEQRLAFRELGLAIGLRAAAWIEDHVTKDQLDSASRELVSLLAAQASRADEIIAFWTPPEHRSTRVWLEHRDINDVMLAAALVPEGCFYVDREQSAARAAGPERGASAGLGARRVER